MDVSLYCQMIAYALGVVNWWRFPYLMVHHGAHIFLFFVLLLPTFAYALFHLIIALDESLESCTSLASRATTVGILVGLNLTRCYFAIYLGIVILWCEVYFFKSLEIYPPWRECPPANGDINDQCLQHGPSLHFWSNLGNNTYSGLLMGVLLLWILVFTFVQKKQEGSIVFGGKFTKFLCLSIFLVLICYLVQALTLDGKDLALNLLTPKVESLKRPDTVNDAVSHVFICICVLSVARYVRAREYEVKQLRGIAIVFIIVNFLSLMTISSIVYLNLGNRQRQCHDNQNETSMCSYPLYGKPDVGTTFIALSAANREFSGICSPLMSAVTFFLLTFVGVENLSELLINIAKDITSCGILSTIDSKILGLMCIIGAAINLSLIPSNTANWVWYLDSVSIPYMAILLLVAVQIFILLTGREGSPGDFQILLGTKVDKKMYFITKYVLSTFLLIMILWNAGYKIFNALETSEQEKLNAAYPYVEVICMLIVLTVVIPICATRFGVKFGLDHCILPSTARYTPLSVTEDVNGQQENNPNTTNNYIMNCDNVHIGDTCSYIYNLDKAEIDHTSVSEDSLQNRATVSNN